MKNLITLLFLFVVYFAFGQTNDIVVFSESGDNFTLFVNSIKQNETPRANVKAKDLKGESFVLRVEFENSSIPVITQNIWTESKGIELTANIKKNRKGKYVLRYMGETPKNADTDKYSEAEYVVYEDPEVDNHQADVVEVNTNANTETVTTTIVTTGQVADDKINTSSGVSLNVNVNETGMSVTSEKKKPQTNLGLSVNETGADVSTNVGGENVNISFNINASGLDSNVQTSENVSTTTTTTTTTITSSSSFDTNDLVVVEEVESNYTPVSSRCAYSMSSEEFDEAMQSVKSKSFEDSKLTTAKQICKANCMTAEQVRDMNKTFSFEDTKLEFAKYAYDFVYDVSKYYKVNDSFEFEMTIEELDEFLENK